MNHELTPAVANATAPRRATPNRRWKFLAEASAALDASLDYETTLANVVQLSVPAIADYAGIALLTDDGDARWACAAHRDARKALLVERLRTYDPALSLDADPLGVAVRGGRALLIGDVADEQLHAVAVDETHLALLREIGPTSYIGVPLSARDRTLGVLALCMTRDSGRRYGDADVALAEAVGHRAALAVDRALLYRDAEQARQAREAMVAVVAHDLKNPLSTIQMASSLLLDELVPDDDAHRIERRQLAIVRRSADRMRRLVRDLLDVSAIEAGRLRIERVAQPVRPLVEDALDALRPLAAEKGIELVAEVPAELPPVSADPERVLQVLSNLGGNAIKFTGAHGRVTLGVARIADVVLEFNVSDTGSGIAPDDLPHVFDRYWRAAKTRTGTGLGLAIAKGIVEAHGGRIGATSALGEGSTFRFTLPVITPSPARVVEHGSDA